MGKVIAFDKNRLHSKPHSTAQTRELHSQVGMRSNARLHHFQGKKEGIEVSIVVLASGHPHLLSHCLASLLFQQFEASRYEIIVVDDKPSRAIRDVVNEWAKHSSRSGPGLSYIAGHGNEGIAAARNRGWRAARGALVAFTDDDMVARPDWLQKGLLALEKEAAQAVWGRVITASSAATERMPAADKLQPFVHSNYFVRKAVLDDIGGFDERFKFSWGDEADLYFRLCSSRVRIVHYPQAVVTQPSRIAGLGRFLSVQRSHQAEVLLSKKHPQLYRQKMQKTPYAASYLITAALVLSGVCLLAGATVLAAACGALWLWLTLNLLLRQWKGMSPAPSHVFSSLLSAVLTPPLTTFWHTLGWLRFRRITC